MLAQCGTAAIQHPLDSTLGYADGFAVICHEQAGIPQQFFNDATRDAMAHQRCDKGGESRPVEVLTPLRNFTRDRVAT